MTARPTILILAASLALAPALQAQDHAVPAAAAAGGGSSGGGGSHPSPGVSSSGGGSSRAPATAGARARVRLVRAPRPPSAGTPARGPGVAQRRRRLLPRLPGLPGWGGGGYYPGYWGSWWPYGSFGWYGGYYGGYYGYPWGWGGGGTVYHYVERESGSVRVLVDPSEARVYVDGYYAGTVDDFDGLFQRLNVSPGRHEIALKLEGYKTHRVKVYVAPDSTLKLHYDIEKGQGETLRGPLEGRPRERGAARARAGAALGRERGARREGRADGGGRPPRAERPPGGRLGLRGRRLPRLGPRGLVAEARAGAAPDRDRAARLPDRSSARWTSPPARRPT